MLVIHKFWNIIRPIDLFYRLCTRLSLMFSRRQPILGELVGEYPACVRFTVDKSHWKQYLGGHPPLALHLFPLL